MLKNKPNFANYKSYLLAFVTFSLAACQQVSSTVAAQPGEPTKVVTEMNDKEAEIVAKLRWVETANAETDARDALTSAGSGKVEIIGFSGRGKSFPGLSKDEYAEIEGLVSYSLAKGTGDTIYGPTQKALRMELREYVSSYNKIIYKALTEAK